MLNIQTGQKVTKSPGPRCWLTMGERWGCQLLAVLNALLLHTAPAVSDQLALPAVSHTPSGEQVPRTPCNMLLCSTGLRLCSSTWPCYTCTWGQDQVFEEGRRVSLGPLKPRTSFSPELHWGYHILCSTPDSTLLLQDWVSSLSLHLTHSKAIWGLSVGWAQAHLKSEVLGSGSSGHTGACWFMKNMFKWSLLIYMWILGHGIGT